MLAAQPEDVVGEFVHWVEGWRASPTRSLINRRKAPTIPFTEFRSLVRRYRPSDLLPVLGRLSLVEWSGASRIEGFSILAPWMIATTARESIVFSNDYRSGVVDARAVRRLRNAHINIEEPDLGGQLDSEKMLGIFMRIVHEQMRPQEDPFADASRTHAMVAEGLEEVATKFFTSETENRVFGHPITEVLTATLLIFALARMGGGYVDEGRLGSLDWESEVGVCSLDVVRDRLGKLTATFEEFQAAYHAMTPVEPGHERYAGNPLFDTPIIRVPDNSLLAPDPALILGTMSPAAVFRRGREAFGAADWGTDFGLLVEHYVGRQLSLVDTPAKLYPEVVYDVAKGQSKSADWILVLPELVIVFEAKSYRPTPYEQAAQPGYLDRLVARLDKAFDQIERTVERIRESHPAFSQIPADLPILGVVVTAEAHYLANTDWVRDHTKPTQTPIQVASLAEVEKLVTLPPTEIQRQAVAIAMDVELSTWDLSSALDVGPGGPISNPILDEAEKAYIWFDSAL